MQRNNRKNTKKRGTTKFSLASRNILQKRFHVTKECVYGWINQPENTKHKIITDLLTDLDTEISKANEVAADVVFEKWSGILSFVHIGKGNKAAISQKRPYTKRKTTK